MDNGNGKTAVAPQDPKAAAEIIKVSGQIRQHQRSLKLSDAEICRRFGGLGHTRTYSRIREGDLTELRIERHLPAYQAVLALLDAGGGESEPDELMNDLSGPCELRRVFGKAIKRTGNARFILLEGDTGTGKTSAVQTLLATYGERIVVIEAWDTWKDNPNHMLTAILEALGAGDDEIPTTSVGKQREVTRRLNPPHPRVCLVIEEAHYLRNHCINTIKTLINTTPGEFLATAMPSLWRQLKRAANEECRQLTGNRLAARIKLTLETDDVEAFVTRRVDGLKALDPASLRLLKDRALNYGYFAFLRDVCPRINRLAKGGAVTPEIISKAAQEEVDNR